MAELAQSIAQDLRAALDDDQLDLPSLPEVALQVREEAESEHVSAASLGAVVNQDPGLAAQLVRVANSPLFRATRSIDDLNQAISRLGVEYSANMVTGLAMRQMFQATSELVDGKIRQIWQDAVEMGAWASIVCKRYTRLRPDQANLAGLTHCIGALPVLSWVEEHDHLVRDSLTLDQLIEALHPTLGTMILKHWNFAEDIVCVPESYQKLDREVDAVDYADIACAANLLRRVDTDHPLMQTAWQSASAFKRLGMDPETDEAERAALVDEVGEVRSVFG